MVKEGGTRMDEHLLMRYDCFGCGDYYFLPYVYDKQKTSYCPHCGKKGLNVARYFAEDVAVELGEMDEWESDMPSMRDLLVYLGEHYPEGIGEDIFHEVSEVLLHGGEMEDITTFEDKKLQHLIQTVIDEGVTRKKA